MLQHHSASQLLGTIFLPVKSFVQFHHDRQRQRGKQNKIHRKRKDPPVVCSIARAREKGLPLQTHLFQVTLPARHNDLIWIHSEHPTSLENSVTERQRGGTGALQNAAAGALSPF